MSKVKSIVLAMLASLALTGLLLLTTNAWTKPAGARDDVSSVSPDQAILCVNPGGTGGCYGSIQKAVKDASDGNTIRVAEGTYHETVVLTKSVILEGGWNTDFSDRDWDVYVTTIDAQRTDSVIQVEGVISPTIEGFVVTGGEDSAGLGWGGGIRVHYSGLGHGGTTAIRHNVITDNIACSNCGAAGGNGGGIHVYNSTAIIEHNTVISNTAKIVGEGRGEGGGVHIDWSAEATLTGNTIVSNTAIFSSTGLWGAGEGGGLYLYGSDVTLIDNEIYGNVAAVRGTGRGGGLYAAGHHYDNRILNNTASISGTGYGGGVYANWVQDFNDNLVQGNVASQYGDGTGGGIYAIQLQEARRNTIVDNVATRGGGMYLGQYSRTEMRNNFIAHNQATGLWGMNGGGGISSEDDEAEIVGNQVVSNTAFLGHGGGVLITGGDNYVLRDNLIRNNVAYLGGGAFVYSATGTIAHNQVVSNTAFSGGGAYLFTEASPAMDRNVVMGNTVWGDPVFPGLGGAGLFINIGSGVPLTLTNHIIARNILLTDTVVAGGVFCLSGDVKLINNTVADNDPGTGGDGLVFVTGAATGALRNNIIIGHDIGVWMIGGAVGVLDYNDYYDNVADTVGVSWGPNHLTDAPQFDNRAVGDYHLALTSSLIDQGDSSVTVPLDFEGDPRPLGGGIDVGADEAYRAETYVSVFAGNDTTGDGSSGNPFATVMKGLGETRTGGTVYVGRGQYTERITVTRSVNLLGGYHESDWSRNIASHATTLDAEGMGTVVVIQGEGVQATVEGFTITGGEANLYGSGGGFVVHDKAAATIRHNAITGNHAQNGGGGLLVWGNESVESVIDSNRIYDNMADGEFPSLPRAEQALLRPQQGPEPGGGLLIAGGPARVVNNFVYGNTSAIGGDGMALMGWYGPVQVIHNTVADNGGNGGEGIKLMGSDVYLYNNLIAGHGTGISTTATTQAIWNYNGFYDNGATYAPGLTGGTHDVEGNPQFADRAGGDYHIGPASAMTGRGMDAGVNNDADGDPRPAPEGTYPDLGADEIRQSRIYLPLVLRTTALSV
ncbi:MAG TPA: right-handed parallel beta-helix repeat-containing protein [Anaerolineae bacterium]|nr:right-handed parallel beta-helix repeat-containing protein [Anaerolineae bacterium]